MGHTASKEETRRVEFNGKGWPEPRKTIATQLIEAILPPMEEHELTIKISGSTSIKRTAAAPPQYKRYRDHIPVNG